MEKNMSMSMPLLQCNSTGVQLFLSLFYGFQELSAGSPPCSAKAASGASLILDKSQSSSVILDSDDLSDV